MASKGASKTAAKAGGSKAATPTVALCSQNMARFGPRDLKQKEQPLSAADVAALVGALKGALGFGWESKVMGFVGGNDCGKTKYLRAYLIVPSAAELSALFKGGAVPEVFAKFPNPGPLQLSDVNAHDYVAKTVLPLKANAANAEVECRDSKFDGENVTFNITQTWEAEGAAHASALFELVALCHEAYAWFVDDCAKNGALYLRHAIEDAGATQASILAAVNAEKKAEHALEVAQFLAENPGSPVVGEREAVTAGQVFINEANIAAGKKKSKVEVVALLEGLTRHNPVTFGSCIQWAVKETGEELENPILRPRLTAGKDEKKNMFLAPMGKPLRFFSRDKARRAGDRVVFDEMAVSPGNVHEVLTRGSEVWGSYSLNELAMSKQGVTSPVKVKSVVLKVAPPAKDKSADKIFAFAGLDLDLDLLPEAGPERSPKASAGGAEAEAGPDMDMGGLGEADDDDDDEEDDS